MLKLKQKGKNPDYPEEGILWTLEGDGGLPDWVSNNFKVILGTSGDTELCYQETSLGYQITMFSFDGTKKYINIKDKTDGGLIFSKTHMIFYLNWKCINLLYDKKELQH